MLKFIGAGLLFLPPFLIGIFCSAKLSRRVLVLEQLVRFFCALETEMKFTKERIDVILRKLSGHENLSALTFIPAAVQKLPAIPLPLALCSAIEQSAEEMLLSKDEAESLAAFCSALGSTDFDGQQKNIQLYNAEFLQYLHDARLQKDKKGGFYRTLGTLAGAAAAILVI